MSSNGWTSVMQNNEGEKTSFSFLWRKPIYLIVIILVLLVIGFILWYFYYDLKVDATPSLTESQGYGSRINRPPIINLSEKKLNPVMTDSLFTF